ncbi:hypothetical protein D9758_016080 [Tetrapyrgos nigripes]|uniref:Reverse transcriptase domain-containing protein n=1 Tax=Tetrapyrgos nigripes TaxID=182062 RepID=A0A8H5FEZ2_9AGAR|nr:hypothetical protein D9758_016080 [Tetrapyrgos nigripes]
MAFRRVAVRITTLSFFVLVLRRLVQTLWVASVDISNAFPSVHRASLWLKLKRFGAGGKIFDWLRTLYYNMKYQVCHGGTVSHKFTSAMGILAGDTVSPLLWLLYFSDFKIPESDDDVVLNDAHVSHLEQADDLLLISLSQEGLQRKLEIFYCWCCSEFMIVNALKCAIAYHGNKPRNFQTFHIGDDIINIVMEYTYVGMTFRGGPINLESFHLIFKPHYEQKAAKARKIAHATLHVEQMIGSLPPADGKTLYTALVDPHLTYGCEVALDTGATLSQLLQKVQSDFLRRLLGFSKRSTLVPLYTETGLSPVLYRRMELAIRYLAYALQRPTNSLVYCAVMESINLHIEGEQSWFTDLLKIIEKNIPESADLAVPSLDDFMDSEKVIEFHACILKVLPMYIEEWLQA